MKGNIIPISVMLDDWYWMFNIILANTAADLKYVDFCSVIFFLFCSLVYQNDCKPFLSLYTYPC